MLGDDIWYVPLLGRQVGALGHGGQLSVVCTLICLAFVMQYLTLRSGFRLQDAEE